MITYKYNDVLTHLDDRTVYIKCVVNAFKIILSVRVISSVFEGTFYLGGYDVIYQLLFLIYEIIIIY